MKIQTLLLDLDGTLIDSTQDLAESVRHIQNYYAIPLSTDREVASYIGDGIGMLVARALSPHVHPRGRRRINEKRGAALPAFENEKHAEAVKLLKRYYTQHCMEHTAVYPGVVETLKHFAELKMAVVTNKPERVSRRILKGLGLDAYISVVVGGDTLPEKKPNPAPLHHALAQLENSPVESAVMVGDTCVDVEAGRAAGMRTVGILSNIGEHKALRAAGPDFLIGSFSELAQLRFLKTDD